MDSKIYRLVALTGLTITLILAIIVLLTTVYQRLSPNEFFTYFTMAITLLITGLTAAYAYSLAVTRSKAAQLRDEVIKKLEVQVEKEPEKARPAWTLASEKLEAYLDRNLSQINYIFVATIVTMIVGFGFIGYGVMQSISNQGATSISLVSAVSGILTQFIGATFMAIYRSTMKQATSYMSVLERINSIGMAVQILDSITDDDQKLQNNTKADLVKLLGKVWPS
jgi:hypothetical protein